MPSDDKLEIFFQQAFALSASAELQLELPSADSVTATAMSANTTNQLSAQGNVGSAGGGRSGDSYASVEQRELILRLEPETRGSDVKRLLEKMTELCPALYLHLYWLSSERTLVASLDPLPDYRAEFDPMLRRSLPFNMSRSALEVVGHTLFPVAPLWQLGEIQTEQSGYSRDLPQSYSHGKTQSDNQNPQQEHIQEQQSYSQEQLESYSQGQLRNDLHDPQRDNITEQVFIQDQLHGSSQDQAQGYSQGQQQEEDKEPQPISFQKQLGGDSQSQQQDHMQEELGLGQQSSDHETELPEIQEENEIDVAFLAEEDQWYGDVPNLATFSDSAYLNQFAANNLQADQGQEDQAASDVGDGDQPQQAFGHGGETSDPMMTDGDWEDEAKEEGELIV